MINDRTNAVGAGESACRGDIVVDSPDPAFADSSTGPDRSALSLIRLGGRAAEAVVGDLELLGQRVVAVGAELRPVPADREHALERPGAQPLRRCSTIAVTAPVERVSLLPAAAKPSPEVLVIQSNSASAVGQPAG